MNDYSLHGAQLSPSVFRRMMECPAAAVAEYTGQWQRESSAAMLAGRYIHTALLQPDKLGELVDANREAIYKKARGSEPAGMRSEFVDAAAAVDAARACPQFMASIRGVVETVVVFDFEGVKWKCQPDSMCEAESAVTDIKRVGNSMRHYDLGLRRYVEFYDGRAGASYWFQLAMYRIAYQRTYGSWPENVAIAALLGSDPVGVRLKRFESAGRWEREMLCAARLQGEFVAMLAEKRVDRVGPVCYDAQRDDVIWSRACDCDYCRLQYREDVAESAE